MSVCLCYAVYVRTAAGRCIHINLQSDNVSDVECSNSTDVMLELESACTGRQSCQVLVNETTFSRVTPCPDEVESYQYLVVIYRCTTGNILIQRLLEPLRVTLKFYLTVGTGSQWRHEAGAAGAGKGCAPTDVVGHN